MVNILIYTRALSKLDRAFIFFSTNFPISTSRFLIYVINKLNIGNDKYNNIEG